MSEIDFDREKFVGAIGSTFTAKAEGVGPCELSLVEVTESKDGRAYTSYSILFLAPENLPTEQGLYELQHESLDPVALFLVPVGTVGERVKLEAVFNFAKDSPAS